LVIYYSRYLRFYIHTFDKSYAEIVKLLNMFIINPAHLTEVCGVRAQKLVRDYMEQ